MSESVIIRKGIPADIPAVLGLIKELAFYEKAPLEVTNTEADMLRDGFGPDPAYRLLVAELEGIVVGMAIYFIKYSTWKGKGVYLDDIVVTEALHGNGIGAKLFDAVMKDAVALDAKQMHWQVLDWNEPAIRFYRRYHCDFDGEWVNCKLNAQQLIELTK
jgi:GNAT superfamily N-acetyltransferase